MEAVFATKTYPHCSTTASSAGSRGACSQRLVGPLQAPALSTPIPVCNRPDRCSCRLPLLASPPRSASCFARAEAGPRTSAGAYVCHLTSRPKSAVTRYTNSVHSKLDSRRPINSGLTFTSFGSSFGRTCSAGASDRTRRSSWRRRS